MDLGKWKRRAVKGWRESGATTKAKFSADDIFPLPAWESEVAQRLWSPGPAMYPEVLSVCICQNKVNPLREQLRKLVQADVFSGCWFHILSPCPDGTGSSGGRTGAGLKSCHHLGA